MSTRVDISLDVWKEHRRELVEAERLGWTSIALRRHFGPLVAVILRPRDDVTKAILTIRHDDDVILKRTFEASIRAASASEPRVVTTAVDHARKFAEEWIDSIRPGVAP